MDARRFTFDGNETEWVSVAIHRVPEHCNMHTGILYRDAEGNLFWLHFGWHRTLFHQMYDESVACTIPPLDEVDAIFVSGMCGRIARARKNKQIPYSLKHDPAVSFDPLTGDISLTPGSTGVNCATFVIAVFRSASNELVDTVDWPANRDGDAEQQQIYVDMLRRSLNPENQQQARIIAGEVGSYRIRPEEVAGACLEDELPCGFEVCESNGRFVCEMIDSDRGDEQVAI